MSKSNEQFFEKMRSDSARVKSNIEYVEGKSAAAGSQLKKLTSDLRHAIESIDGYIGVDAQLEYIIYRIDWLIKHHEAEV